LESSDFFFEESVSLHILNNRVHTFITKADCFDDLTLTGYTTRLQKFVQLSFIVQEGTVNKGPDAKYKIYFS